MGQPPSADEDPSVWVNSRQYTGRLVTITNGVIFSEPVYNYSSDFPYIWEEIAVPIAYDEDRTPWNRSCCGPPAHAVVDDPTAHQALDRMRPPRHVRWHPSNLQVFWRLTDNHWNCLCDSVVPGPRVCQVKDAISREILAGLDAHKITIASATYDILVRPRPELAGHDRTVDEGENDDSQNVQDLPETGTGMSASRAGQWCLGRPQREVPRLRLVRRRQSRTAPPAKLPIADVIDGEVRYA